jgi:hypothetical protein
VSGQHIFSSDVYFVSKLPSQVAGGDVLLICSAGFVMSFLATVYPAWRAAKIEPAHVAVVSGNRIRRPGLLAMSWAGETAPAASFLGNSITNRVHPQPIRPNLPPWA